MPVRQRISVEDYLALPEEKPYLEYVNGEVYRKPTPHWMHVALVERIADALRDYRRHGTDACWLVHPKTRTVEIFEGDRDGDVPGEGATLTAAALPGFELSLRELFAVIDEEE